MERTFATRAGLELAADVLDGGRTTPVVLLHGGGQTRHAWGDTAASLHDRGWTTIAVDLRGHGDSGWSPDGRYAPEQFAGDVRDLAAALPAPPVLVGASLGGLSSLLALGGDDPPAAAGLVLVDVAHRFHAPGGQRIIAFMRAHPDGFDDLEQVAAHVSAYLPHRQAPEVAAGLARNVRTRDGRLHWHWDPALLDVADVLEDPEAMEARNRRLAAAVARIEVPMLLVRGGASDIVTPGIADEFVRLAPGARVVEVAGAAHMVAGDRNARFTEAVAAFIEELDLP